MSWKFLKKAKKEEYVGSDTQVKDAESSAANIIQPTRQPWKFWKTAKKGDTITKAIVLYHESEDVVKLEKKEIKDGNITIGDKTFDIDKFRPKLIKRGFGYMPLYMLKWDTMNPPTEFNPTFNPDKNLNPEIYQKTMRLKILGNMLKIEKKKNIWLLVAVGVAFGIFLAYYLFGMGIIKM
jgi:hypothetical protein